MFAVCVDWLVAFAYEVSMFLVVVSLSVFVVQIELARLFLVGLWWFRFGLDFNATIGYCHAESVCVYVSAVRSG